LNFVPSKKSDNTEFVAHPPSADSPKCPLGTSQTLETLSEMAASVSGR